MIIHGVVADSLIAPSGGGAWTPADLPSLHGWWDFSDTSTITLSGSEVTQVNDLSGNGNDLVEGVTAGRRPESGLDTLNGLNVLRFSAGSKDRLAMPDISSGTAYSIFVVLARRSAQGGWRSIVVTPTTGSNIQFALQTSSVGPIGAWTGTTRTSSFTLPAAGTGAHLIGIDYNGPPTGGGTFYGDGATAGTYAGTMQGQSETVLGSGTNGSQDPDVLVGEFIVCTAVLSSGDITSLTDYLTAKWGI